MATRIGCYTGKLYDGSVSNDSIKECYQVLNYKEPVLENEELVIKKRNELKLHCIGCYNCEEAQKDMEKEVKIINSIIKEAIFYGSTMNSECESNKETLFETINNWLKLKNLNEKYEIGIDIDDERYAYQLFNTFESRIRKFMLDKWKKIYNDNDVCMVHLLSSDEANELTENEKNDLLLWAGEDN